MSLNQAEIERVVAELRGPLAGSKVQKIRQPRPRVVALEGFGQAGAFALLVSADRTASRIHLTTRKLDNPPTPPAFCMLLRKELVGRRIEGIATEEGDRIVTLIFSGRGEGGMLSLVCELTGRNANLLLVDGDDRVRGVLDARFASRRGLAVGSPYALPPRPPAGRTFTAREFDGTGTYSERLDAHYGEAGETDALDREKSRIAKAIRRGTKRLEKYVRAAESRRADLSDYQTLRHHAELLKASLAGLPKQAARVQLTDYDGTPLALDLDPKLPVAENADALFKKARKHERGLVRLETQDGQNRERLDALNAIDARVAAAADFEALHALSSDLTALGLPAPGDVPDRTPPSPKRSRVQEPTGPHRFEAEDGTIILVGRNDEENDRLSTRLASGNDYFFHVRGLPGSHVIVRLERGAELTQTALLDAAHLAVFYSKLKGRDTGEVSYTRCKYVRKPKGYPPGKVTISGEKTIRLHVDPARLQRLLEAKNAGKS